MSQGERIGIESARIHADRVLRTVEPLAQMSSVAGSVRRGDRTVGDIELVVISKQSQEPTLFSEGVPGGFDVWKLDSFPAWHRVKGGDKVRTYEVADVPVPVEVYRVEPHAWATQLAIRTGPAAFSRAIVTNRSRGGWLPNGYRIQGGHLTDPAGKPMAVSERDLIQFACGRWIEPEDRARFRS